MKTKLFFVFLLFPLFVHAQIRTTSTPISNCNACLVGLKNLPAEVKYGLRKDANDVLYFYITHAAWFSSILPEKNNGFVIDIVQASEYACDKRNPRRLNGGLGTLLKTFYKNELVANMQATADGGIQIPLFKLPPHLRHNNLEYNLIFLYKDYECQYIRFYQLEAFKWHLLKLMLYVDKTVYPTDFENQLTLKNKVEFTLEKDLVFTIPFEQGKTAFSPEDIAPLYDSLNLTNYIIKEIDIKAYSSVEGNEENNIRLQEGRATSIVDALGFYQKESIKTTVSASENWFEFYNDLEKTTYAHFKALPKETIKEQLTNKKVSTDLEPYLKNHRKAVVSLKIIDKKIVRSEEKIDLPELFKQAIEKDNLKDAAAIQNEIFFRVYKGQLPASTLSSLKMPYSTKYDNLLNSNSILHYFLDPNNAEKTYIELKKLGQENTENPYNKFNLAVIKLQLLFYDKTRFEHKTFEQEIINLKNYTELDRNFIDKLLTDFYIIVCDYYFKKGLFEEKNYYLNAVYKMYKDVIVNDQDRLSIAQYFAAYGKTDWSLDVIEPRLRSLEIDENLLFYYINLTIEDKSLVNSDFHNSILERALEINKARFCGLFKSYLNGGISFQILENETLKDFYCKQCN